MNNQPIIEWRILYTKANFEAKAKHQFKNLGYTTYLPIIKKHRLWSDRIKKSEVPMFRNYVFVQTKYNEYIDLQKIYGAVKFLKSEKKYCTIGEKEIQLIQNIEKGELDVSVIPINLCIGDKVRITKGSLKDCYGYLIFFKGKYRVAIRLEGLMCGIIVDIRLDYIEKII